MGNFHIWCPMNSILKRINEDGERWLLLIFYTTIVATIAVEVVRRFGLSYSSVWGEEIARYAFIYLAWIGASAAVKRRAHIRIDILLHYVSPRWKAGLYLFGDLMTLLLAVIIIFYSVESVLVSIKFGSVTDGLRISQAWFLAAVPLGFSMMGLRLIQSILRDIDDLRHGNPVYTGDKLIDE
ncbi:MAG: TRAP-type C4-dicarboxylate transport system permease small subunit [Cellvibrionaceae bacterium]|jgi:TRAP-type C4-dicarboxylate transport system permease small subunit